MWPFQEEPGLIQKFDVIEVNEIICRSIESVIGGKLYEDLLANDWCAKVAEVCLVILIGLNKRMKYIVTSSILPRKGIEFFNSSTCLWDSTKDGTTTIRWRNESLYCIVSVFGIDIPNF